MSQCVIDCWQSSNHVASKVDILPDGCQDTIMVFSDDRLIRCFISPVFTTTHQAHLQANTHSIGFRLAAGTGIQSKTLLEQLHRRSVDPVSMVEECTHLNADVAEALNALRQHHGSIWHVAKQIGVSSRTLQRLLLKHTGKSPLFWLRLAKIRACSQALTVNSDYAELACQYGYSDQSHLCREMKHWFGVTPKQLIQRPDLVAQLQDPAY